jgi:RecA-family ATPase
MVGMATKGASGGSAEGEAAFDQWSQKHPSYDAEKTAKLWKGLRPKDIGFGTLKHLADETRAKRQSQSTDFVIKPKKDENEPPTLQSMFLEELHAQPVEPLEWIVKDLIVEGAINGLFGDGGTGKDRILFQLAIAMTCGAQWLGHDVKQGKVMYFTTEDPVKELRRREDRIAAYYDQMGMYNPVPKQLKIFPMMGKETVLTKFDSKAGVVRSTPLFTSICKAIGDFKPDLIIVGNRVNIFAVNQNDDAQARQCLGYLNGIIVEYGNPTIIMPGHVSLIGQRTGEGTSGSVQWSNGVRQRLYLRRVKDDKEEEIDPNMRELEVMKSNWAPTGKIVSLEWRDGLFMSDSVEVKPASPEADANRDRKDEDEVLRLLDALRSGDTVSPKRFAPNNIVTRFKRGSLRFNGKLGEQRLDAAITRLYTKKIIETIIKGSKSRETAEVVRVTGRAQSKHPTLRLVEENKPKP